MAGIESRLRTLENQFPKDSELDILFNSLGGYSSLDSLSDNEVNRLYDLGVKELGFPDLDNLTDEEIKVKLELINKFK